MNKGHVHGDLFNTLGRVAVLVLLLTISSAPVAASGPGSAHVTVNSTDRTDTETRVRLDVSAPEDSQVYIMETGGTSGLQASIFPYVWAPPDDVSTFSIIETRADGQAEVTHVVVIDGRSGAAFILPVSAAPSPLERIWLKYAHLKG